MSCEKYRKLDELFELFDSVVDKEIKDSSKKKLFAHLEECSACNFQWKVYNAAINGMERMEEVEAPADLTVSVMKGISEQPQPVWEAQPLPFLRPASTSWMWAGAFAVAFFLMIGTFVNWDGSQATKFAQLPAVPQGDTTEVPHLGEDRNHDDLAGAAVKGDRAHVPANTELGIVLVQHTGEVEVLDLTTNEWRGIHGQENLNFGDRVRTGAGGEASLEYTKEKVVLRVKPDSTLQVLDRQTLRVYAGATWVSVKRKGTIFRTETPNAIASVRGTKYSVNVKPLPVVYADEMVRSLTSQPTHNAPVAQYNLGAYSTQVALSLIKRLSDPKLPSSGDTSVNVYESVVEVVAKNAAGAQVSAIDVKQGFGTNVQLAQVTRPKVLSVNDWMPWQSVMPYDQDTMSAAQNQPIDANPLPAAGATTVMPATQPAADTSGPASSSERPQGYDDINRAK